MIKVVSLDSSYEQLFLNYALQDVFDYHFFIIDWKFYRDSTKIFLALEEKRIVGLMLVYKERTVQFRGGIEAIKALMKHLTLEKAFIIATQEHLHTILSRYDPLEIQEIVLMILRRGEERLYIKHKVTALNSSSAREIAELLRQSSPRWTEITADQIIADLEHSVLWLGVKEGEEILSAGSVRLLDIGSNIGRVATRLEHRNRGYATTIVSALVKEILRTSECALIHVLSDNFPAINVYRKVGFRQYKAYILLEGRKR